MRVYSKIVINLKTGETECADWVDDYTGPIAECKGGGGPQVDKEYNAGMLEISRQQQAMAQEMFNLFKFGVTYDPTEIDPKTGKTLGEMQGYDQSAMVSELKLTQEKIAAESELLPLEKEREKARLESETGLIKERTPVVSEMYKEALRGVDIGKRVSEARAGVQHAFKGAEDITRRGLSRLGIDPSSGKALAAFSGIGMELAKTTAGAEADIRREAEFEDFQRKVTASRII